MIVCSVMINSSRKIYVCVFSLNFVENRGAHSFWLKNGTVQGAGDVCINQLHYNDAAEVAIAALRRGICVLL